MILVTCGGGSKAVKVVTRTQVGQGDSKALRWVNFRYGATDHKVGLAASDATLWMPLEGRRGR
jgi:hypothetical protein